MQELLLGGEDWVGGVVLGVTMKRSTSSSSSEEVEVVCTVGECDGAAKVVGAEVVSASIATTMDSV